MNPLLYESRGGGTLLYKTLDSNPKPQHGALPHSPLTTRDLMSETSSHVGGSGTGRDRMKRRDAVVLLIERDGHLTYVPLELN